MGSPVIILFFAGVSLAGFVSTLAYDPGITLALIVILSGMWSVLVLRGQVALAVVSSLGVLGFILSLVPAATSYSSAVFGGWL